jgi:DNA-binding MarR family transcriptional regulator
MVTRKPSAAKPHTDWLALDNQLCFSLYSASLAMTKLYKPLLDPLGLTYPQYLVMLALWETDDVMVSTIGERLHLDSGTLTPLLKRLEAAGLVQRERSAEDERRVHVKLTPQGSKLRERAVCVPQQVFTASGCSMGELRELTQQLKSLRDTLQASLH